MSKTVATYAQRILNVQLFIQQHLDEELTLERLSTVAGYSPYHFHRIFRGQLGESTDDYVRRLRMEKAAQSLRYRKRSVLEIALDAGYGSHEAFTRAFQRTFGVSPSVYQSLEHHPPAIQEAIMSTTQYVASDVEIRQCPPLRLAGFRVVGPYNSEFLGPQFQRVGEWASANQMLTPETYCIGLYHDDPEVTPPDKQRADVGITVSPDFVPTGDVQIQNIIGGTYAVLCHKGTYDKLHDSYRWLYAVWLPESGREPADAPPYERYLNDCSTVAVEDLLTEICVPLL